VLVYVGAGILAYTAGSMMVHEPRLHDFFVQNSLIATLIPIITVVLVLVAGYIVNQIKLRKAHN
jgi:predicted tellurium resistance membrane protein TerC